jgi:hypothetical protein
MEWNGMESRGGTGAEKMEYIDVNAQDPIRVDVVTSVTFHEETQLSAQASPLATHP